MKHRIKFLASAFALAAAASANAQVDLNKLDILSGDERTACECVLCLSSGTRPSECMPPLKKYFSIKAKKMSDTIKKRKDFLELCPASNETPEMKSLVNAIANGAGRCDAAELNRAMARQIEAVYCDGKIIQFIDPLGKYNVTNQVKTKWGGNYAGYGGLGGQECQSYNKQPYKIIEPTRPGYCAAYAAHEYTDLTESTVYQGAVLTGGRWVDK